MSTSPGSSPSADRRRSQYTSGQASVDAKIDELVGGVEDVFDRNLIRELVVSACRLGQDRAATGDLKVLNAAVKEICYAFKVFRPYRHIRKVAMFGSARVSHRHPAYAMAKAFGRLMTQHGWMMITGAASGIMRAGHEGSGRVMSFGLNIRLPFEQAANPVISGDTKLINCKYFFTRKLLFIKESHATVLFPGGFGTFDEGFESLTLIQTGKSEPRPIVFVEPPDRPFWRPLLQFLDRQLVEDGMISSSDRALYQVARSAEEAADLVLGFYRVYHSQRYVGDRLVLRLQEPLSDVLVERLNREFADLLSSGAITQGGALPGEADEPHLKHLPRLIFRYNQQQFGRLVELIHRINAAATPRRQS